MSSPGKIDSVQTLLCPSVFSFTGPTTISGVTDDELNVITIGTKTTVSVQSSSQSSSLSGTLTSSSSELSKPKLDEQVAMKIQKSSGCTTSFYWN